MPDIVSEEADLSYGVKPLITNPEIAMVPDRTYNVEPVISETELPQIPDMTYGVEPVVTEPELPLIPDLSYGVEPIIKPPEIASLPSMTYNVEPVMENIKLLEGVIPDILYMVNPIVADMNLPIISDVFYDVSPLIEDVDLSKFDKNQLIKSVPDLTTINNSILADIEGPATATYESSDNDNKNGEQRLEPLNSEENIMYPFAPVITIQVQGVANDESIENMTEALRSTVRELYDEFQAEELERMSLKNQYSFR